MRLIATVLALAVLAGCAAPQFDPTFGEPDKVLPAPVVVEEPDKVLPPVALGPVTGEPDKLLPSGIAPLAPIAPTVPTTDADVRVVATEALSAVQGRSIREAREYCGYIVRTAAGAIEATPANAGTLASCPHIRPAGDVTILASYHTHGRFDQGYDNEVPSPGDLRGDFQRRIDGYVSTPGGRLWHVDFETRTAYQLCRSCMVSDPNAREVGPPVRTSYTLSELQRLR